MWLLWVRHNGLDIDNIATRTANGDNLRVNLVCAALEAYIKPHRNQILSRYQLRCLKQCDMPLEEFITKAHLVVDYSGHEQVVKVSTLRDTLVGGVKYDRIWKDLIALGNTLTFNQVYNLARVEESTKAQIGASTQSGDKSDPCAVHSQMKCDNKMLPENQKCNTIIF